jgi:hypothetical protein
MYWWSSGLRRENRKQQLRNQRRRNILVIPVAGLAILLRAPPFCIQPAYLSGLLLGTILRDFPSLESRCTRKFFNSLNYKLGIGSGAMLCGMKYWSDAVIQYSWWKCSMWSYRSMSAFLPLIRHAWETLPSRVYILYSDLTISHIVLHYRHRNRTNYFFIKLQYTRVHVEHMNVILARPKFEYCN